MKRNIPIRTLREPANRATKLLTLSAMPLILLALWLPEKAFGVGHWTTLTSSNTVSDGIGLLMLLPDGTVLAEGGGANWWRLTPDSNGSYVNGAWTQRTSSTWGHQTGSTVVLTNGNVFVSGGENGNGTNKVEIYYPASDSWSTAVSAAYFGSIYDGNGMLMPNGEVLIEPQAVSQGYGGDSFLFNPVNNTFSQTTTSPLSGIYESSWVKLPNDDILVVDSGNSDFGATTSEYYDPSTETWYDAGGPVPNIWPDMSGTYNGTNYIVSEMGPGFLLPNGTAVFFGGNGVSAVYDNGSWFQSASLPGTLGQKDGPGAMMVNGKVLLAVSPQGNNGSRGQANGVGPTSFYEYDYTGNNYNGTFTPAPSPSTSGTNNRAGVFTLLDLPDGTVLCSDGGAQLYDYQPDLSPLPAGQPTINSVRWNLNGTLHLTGTLFNGITEGAAFGDDEQMASNFPLIRFLGASGIFYGSSYNWSSTSVQTGSRIVTTDVIVPPNVLDFPGQWVIQVVANGNASVGVSFYSPVWVDFNLDTFQFGYYVFPYYTLPPAVSEINSSYPGGTIAIRGDQQPSVGHVTVPYTISTPMTIITVTGPSTIGQ